MSSVLVYAYCAECASTGIFGCPIFPSSNCPLLPYSSCWITHTLITVPCAPQYVIVFLSPYVPTGNIYESVHSPSKSTISGYVYLAYHGPSSDHKRNKKIKKHPPCQLNLRVLRRIHVTFLVIQEFTITRHPFLASVRVGDERHS